MLARHYSQVKVKIARMMMLNEFTIHIMAALKLSDFCIWVNTAVQGKCFIHHIPDACSHTLNKPFHCFGLGTTIKTGYSIIPYREPYRSRKVRRDTDETGP